MKKLELIIQSNKLDKVTSILEKADITEYYMTDIMKNTKHSGMVKKYRGAEYPVTKIAQIKVEVVVADDVAKSLILEIKKELTLDNMKTMSSEQEKNGKLYIYDVYESIDL